MAHIAVNYTDSESLQFNDPTLSGIRLFLQGNEVRIIFDGNSIVVRADSPIRISPTAANEVKLDMIKPMRGRTVILK